MSDIMAISNQIKDYQLEEVENCPCCGEKLEEVISKIHSTYCYCNKCSYNKDVAIKNIELDSILKSIKDSILDIDCEDIKLNIINNEENVSLYINDNFISSTEWLYKLNNKEMKTFRYTVLDLIEDSLGEGKTRYFVNIEM